MIFLFYYLLRCCNYGNNRIQYTAVLGLAISNDKEQIIITANNNRLACDKMQWYNLQTFE